MKDLVETPSLWSAAGLGALLEQSLGNSLLTGLSATLLSPMLGRWVRPELRHWLGASPPEPHRPALAGLSGLLGLLMAWTIQWLTDSMMSLGQSLALGFWAASLAQVARIDLSVRLIPDRLTVLLAAIGLLISLIGIGIPIGEALLGGMIGYGLPYAIGQLMSRRRRRAGLTTHSEAPQSTPETGPEESGIGRGDLALIAAMGTWVGFSGLSLVLVLSAGLMLPVLAWGMLRRGWSSQSLLPFGPALAVAGLAVLPWSWLEWGLWPS